MWVSMTTITDDQGNMLQHSGEFSPTVPRYSDESADTHYISGEIIRARPKLKEWSDETYQHAYEGALGSESITGDGIAHSKISNMSTSVAPDPLVQMQDEIQKLRKMVLHLEENLVALYRRLEHVEKSPNVKEHLPDRPWG